jgi:glycosyltransferase involved in cell wall biosynthesis
VLHKKDKTFSIPAKKLKVVWLCYFTNAQVQDILKPRKRIGEIAPWISSMIPLFENDLNVELHVVSEHRWISGIKHFVHNGVHYHFYNRGIPYIGRHWPGFFSFDLFTNYHFLKRSVAKIVKSINPDIIHMQGSENEFCVSILQFHIKYPVFVTVQGILSNTIFASNSKNKRTLKRMANEQMVYSMFKHFGYRTETMGKDIMKLSPSAILHWHNYPMKKIELYETEKQFDLVFFARITKEKGIEDLLQAVSMIKNTKSDISLCVMGGGKTEGYQKMIENLNIADNVHWAGFLPTQKDVHIMVSRASICVLPVYSEIISGTIVESLFLKIPVVAYNVGSIHEVNKYNDIVTLVPRGDVQELSDAIFQLLNDKNLQQDKAVLGYLRALEMFSTSNDEIKNDLFNAYKATIDDFKNS